MLGRRHEQRRGVPRPPFNSLFEMPVGGDAVSADLRDVERLSILYLRCLEFARR